MKQSESLNELAKALAAFQSQVEMVNKGSQGYNYKYSDLSQVISTAKAILAANHLSVSQLLGITEQGFTTITTMLMHASGQYISNTCIVPQLTAGKNLNAAQALGSAISYMRRYSYQAILGMTSDDNDASNSHPVQQAAPTFHQPQQQYQQRQ